MTTMTTTTTATTTTEETTMLRVAASVLFGERFAAQAPDELLADFRSSQQLWEGMIRQVWAFRDGAGAPAGVPASRASSNGVVAAVPAATPEPAASNGAGDVPGVAWFEQQATTAEDAGRAGSGKAADPSPEPTVVFDPSSDQITINVPQSREELRTRLVDLLSEVSGYPPDVFQDDLDLEVDLGIDSLKQAQTLGRVRAESGLELDESFQLRDHQTLGKVVDHLASRLGL